MERIETPLIILVLDELKAGKVCAEMIRGNQTEKTPRQPFPRFLLNENTFGDEVDSAQKPLVRFQAVDDTAELIPFMGVVV